MKSPLNPTSPGFSMRRTFRSSATSSPRWGCRYCFGSHPTETCDLARKGAGSGSPRTVTPRRTPRTQSVNMSPRIAGNNKAFTRPCKFFLEGKCIKGTNCTFLHEIHTPSHQIPVNRHPSSAPAQQMTFIFPTDHSPNPPLAAPPKSPMKAYSRPTSTRASKIQTLKPLIDIHRKISPRYTPGPPTKKIVPPPALNLNFIDDIKPSKSPHTSLSKQEVSSAGSASSDLSLPNDPSFYRETPSPRIPTQTPTTPLTPSKAFTRPCKYFQQGFCVKGASCTFLHSTQEVPQTPSNVDTSIPCAAEVDPNKLFIRLCRYYVKGQCTKGEACTFIHPTDEQLKAIRVKSSELPMSLPEQFASIITPAAEAQSPRLCLNVNATPTSITLGNPEKAAQSVKATKMFTKVCKFFQLGQCLKGDQCTFIHEKVQEPGKLSPKLLPSKEFEKLALENDSGTLSTEKRTVVQELALQDLLVLTTDPIILPQLTMLKTI